MSDNKSDHTPSEDELNNARDIYKKIKDIHGNKASFQNMANYCNIKSKDTIWQFSSGKRGLKNYVFCRLLQAFKRQTFVTDLSDQDLKFINGYLGKYETETEISKETSSPAVIERYFSDLDKEQKKILIYIFGWKRVMAEQIRDFAGKRGITIADKFVKDKFVDFVEGGYQISDDFVEWTKYSNLSDFLEVLLFNFNFLKGTDKNIELRNGFRVLLEVIDKESYQKIFDTLNTANKKVINIAKECQNRPIPKDERILFSYGLLFDQFD